MSSVESNSNTPRLTSLSHGGGCGCKIAPGVLQQILRKAAPVRFAELLVGIETADDAAVYQINDSQAIVATTDFFMPIVDDPFDFGRIAATNAISDVYAMGGAPLFALALVGMPVNVLPLEVIREILDGGEAVCADAGIPIAGGHTIDSVEPIYGLVAIGLVDPKQIKRNAGARAGDVLVLGKPLGVGIYSRGTEEGRARRDRLSRDDCDDDPAQYAGIALAQLDGVHALTDVTGFGLATCSRCVARQGCGARALGDLPLLGDVLALARDGVRHRRLGANWSACAAETKLGAGPRRCGACAAL